MPRIHIRKKLRRAATHHWAWWGAALVLSFFETFLTAAQSYMPVQVSPILVAVLIGICATAGFVCKLFAQKEDDDG